MKTINLARAASRVGMIICLLGAGLLCRPAHAQTPASTPATAPFRSPFPTTKPGPGEEAAFAALVPLFDNARAATDALTAARKCGTPADIAAAKQADAAAQAKLNEAENDYILGYSDKGYSAVPLSFWASDNPSPASVSFYKDTNILNDALAKVSKYKSPPAADCPPKTGAAKPPAAGPEQTPPSATTAPPPFESPFAVSKPRPGEADDFDKLLNLRVAIDDADSRVSMLECDIPPVEEQNEVTAAKAEAELHQAEADRDAARINYRRALDSFVVKYNTNSYTSSPPAPDHTQSTVTWKAYIRDLQLVSDAIEAAAKSRKATAPACPTKPQAANRPEAPNSPPAAPNPPAKPEEVRVEIGLGPSKGEVGVFNASFTADFANFEPSSGHQGNQYGGFGSALVGLNDMLGIQVDGGYHNVSSPGVNLSNWTAAVALVWKAPVWRLAPEFGFQSNSAGGVTDNTYNYGLFGQLYPSNYIVIEAKGGGFSGGFGSAGYYVGAFATGYPTQDLGLTGGIDYTAFTHGSNSRETDYLFRLRYLPLRSVPISLSVGDTYSTFGPGKFHLNAVSVELTYHFGGGRQTSLADYQRAGTLDSASFFAPVGLRF